MKYVDVRVNITYVCNCTNVCVYITYMKVCVYVDICLDVFMYVCTVCKGVCELLGDSTSRQKLQALECELIREDKRVKVGHHTDTN